MTKTNYQIEYSFKALKTNELNSYFSTVTSKNKKAAIQQLRRKVGKGLKIIDVVEI